MSLKVTPCCIAVRRVGTSGCCEQRAVALVERRSNAIAWERTPIKLKRPGCRFHRMCRFGTPRHPGQSAIDLATNTFPGAVDFAGAPNRVVLVAARLDGLRQCIIAVRKVGGRAAITFRLRREVQDGATVLAQRMVAPSSEVGRIRSGCGPRWISLLRTDRRCGSLAFEPALVCV